jgi:hypothetical protein
MLIKTHTTGIHCTGESVEWTVLRKTHAGTEKMRAGTHPVPTGFFDQENAPRFPVEVLQDSHKEFCGIITVSVPSSRLLMRVLELPSADPNELRDMVELQLEKSSPYPLDQMAFSFEVLQQSDHHSRVLTVTAKRSFIDELGERFKEQNIYIRSVDAEILAWWNLLVARGDVPRDGRVILILEAYTEFSMVVVDNGSPVCFRSLELFHDFSNEESFDEIIEEIRYTLLSIETEYGSDDHCKTVIWSGSQFPDALADRLETLSPRGVDLHDLNTLPSLAEGLAMRSMDRTRHHVELVPHEWVDVQRQRKLMKLTAIASMALFGIWLAVVAVTLTVFAVHKASVKRIRAEAALYAGPALAAKNAQKEKESLEKYADRSHSALECLRELTELLPDSLEFDLMNYTKGNAVKLNGSGTSQTTINNYHTKLGASPLFKGTKNYTQGTRNGRKTFNVTVVLPEISTGEETP